MQEEILSVGIDIGTSTTQLIFSKITLENKATSWAVPRILILDKEVIYKSEIYFTPINNQIIDGEEIKKIIEREYKSANVERDKISSGAVIITGETARKENAREISHYLADLAGDFVVATAGPSLESIIAGMGSGACELSKERDEVVANFDIGGGTTNIAIFEAGEVIDTACLDIGGRLIKVNRDKKITYIAPKIKELATKLNLSLKEGGQVKEELKEVIKRMALVFDELLGLAKKTDILEQLLVTSGLRNDYKIDTIIFSGGVAEYIYQAPEANFFKLLNRHGDIGPLLALEVKKIKALTNFKLSKAKAMIRATVIGAGSHTTDISGSTITYNEDILPQKNIAISKLFPENKPEDLTRLAQVIKKKIKWFSLAEEKQTVALAFRGTKNPSFLEIKDYARQICEGLKDYIAADLAIIIVIENDFAKILGQVLKGELKGYNKLICIDNVKVKNGDYIDIGRPLSNGRVLPIVIKTLIFNS